MCWNHLVGVCPYGNKCDWILTHDDGEKLPNEFVDKVVAALQPGVDAMMKEDFEGSARKQELASLANLYQCHRVHHPTGLAEKTSVENDSALWRV